MSLTTTILQQLLALGLTQTAIAKRTGIPQPRLSRWAAGEPPVGADDALKLQQLLMEAKERSTCAASIIKPASEAQETQT